MKATNIVLNVLWLLLCGIWMGLAYTVAGIICCVLIVTIPFGIAAFRLAGFMFWPFGRTMVRRPDAGVASLIGNVIWLVFVGWWLALGHLLTSIPLFLTIIGIPFGWVNLKMIPISLTPLGHKIVPIEEASIG